MDIKKQAVYEYLTMGFTNRNLKALPLNRAWQRCRTLVLKLVTLKNITIKTRPLKNKVIYFINFIATGSHFTIFLEK